MSRGVVVSQVVRRNYIRTGNPFNLQEPPAFFLEQLAALDDDLVIFPSTHEPCYRLCRRTKNTRDIYKVLAHFPDSALLVEHRLAPWKSVLPTSMEMSWQRVLQEIPEYDQWRIGSADQVADHLDTREADAEKRLDREIADGAEQLAAHGYRVIDRQRGSRIHMNEVRGAAPRASGKYNPLSFKRGGSAVQLGR
jgi:hypothetical protein